MGRAAEEIGEARKLNPFDKDVAELSGLPDSLRGLFIEFEQIMKAHNLQDILQSGRELANDHLTTWNSSFRLLF